MEIETLFNVVSGCKKKRVNSSSLCPMMRTVNRELQMRPLKTKVPTRDVFDGNYLTYLLEI